MSRRTRTPSPALIVASAALVLALSGAATALPGKGSVDKNDLARGAVTKKAIKKGAVTNRGLGAGAVDGSKVAADSLGGANINEAALGTVPSAAKVENVTLVGRTSDTVDPDTPTLATAGPFTLRLDCRAASSGFREGLVLIETSEAGSIFANASSTHVLDPGSSRTVNHVTDALGAPASTSVASGGQFTATATSGPTIMGSFSLVVDSDLGDGTCTAFGEFTRVG